MPGGAPSPRVPLPVRRALAMPMACRRCLLTYLLASRYDRETPTSRGRARNPAAHTQPGRYPSLWRRHNRSDARRCPRNSRTRRGGQRQTGTRPKPWTPTTDASHAAGRVGAPRRVARRRPSPWNAPALPCYRARRGGGRDAGGIGPVHRRARRRAPTAGNAKTHSTPSRDDGVEHK